MSARSLVTIVVCLSSLSLARNAFAEEDVDNPNCSAPYSYTSNIAANGNGVGNRQYTVKLIKGGAIQDEATVTASGGYWSHTFTAPTGGWECGSDWIVELWYDGNKVNESCYFSITGCGGAP